jgi:biotin synthase-like enzyme
MRKECPRCQQWLDQNDKCGFCEQKEDYRIGLEASLTRKKEILARKWKVKPSSKDAGVPE